MKIPEALLEYLSVMIAEAETHDSIDSIFRSAGAPGEPPDGSKVAKIREWFRRCNLDSGTEAISVLKTILDKYFNQIPTQYMPEAKIEQRNGQILNALEQHQLRNLFDEGVSAPSKSLEELIKNLDCESINYEFERALANVKTDPYEAVSAACNILESTFKVLLEDAGDELPKKKDLTNLWQAMKKKLNFDASVLEDQDLSRVVGGMASVATGIAALRTHASSAHGGGRFRYKLEPRHIRLSIHAAHTLCVFVIETWQSKMNED